MTAMLTTPTTMPATTSPRSGLNQAAIDVLCAVAEATADRSPTWLSNVADRCPTVEDLDPVLDALHSDGIVTIDGTRVALTAFGYDTCRYL